MGELVDTLISNLNALNQNERAELIFHYHLLLEQTRLMIELSALFQEIFHAWKAIIVQFTSLLQDQDDLADLLSKLMSLSRKRGLEKDVQLVTVNKIAAGPHEGTRSTNLNFHCSTQSFKVCGSLYLLGYGIRYPGCLNNACFQGSEQFFSNLFYPIFS